MEKKKPGDVVERGDTRYALGGPPPGFGEPQHDENVAHSGAHEAVEIEEPDTLDDVQGWASPPNGTSAGDTHTSVHRQRRLRQPA